MLPMSLVGTSPQCRVGLVPNRDLSTIRTFESKRSKQVYPVHFELVVLSTNDSTKIQGDKSLRHLV